MSLFGLCETAAVLRCLLIIKYVIKIIFIVVPILLMYTVISACVKALISGKTEDLSGLASTFIKKTVIALIVFFIPTIISYAFSLIGENFGTMKTCFDNATIESIKYYEKIEPARLALEAVEQNPTEANLKNATIKLNSIISFAKGDTMTNYLARLSQAEIKVNETTLKTQCVMKGGKYANGYCTLPPKTSNKNNSSNNNSTEGDAGDVDYAPGDSVVEYNNNYSVVKSTKSVSDYHNVVTSNRISQDSDSKYSDYCLAFAYIHAYSMYSGDTSARAADALKYTYAYKFSSYTNDSKQNVLSKVYSEITNGKPCVLQVNGNTKGTSRHYVTVVGFKRDVKSGSDLKEEDLLILDSWDGRLETMDPSSSRFMTKGKDCGKDYTGYQMFYIK